MSSDEDMTAHDLSQLSRSDLERRVISLHQEVERLEEQVQEEAKTRSQADADTRISLQEYVDEQISELRQDLVEEQKTRSQHDSKIERRVSMLADETDVDLEDMDVAGEDKIQRLLKYGPEDIADRVYPVHQRARDILKHAGDWGQVTRDKLGQRIVLSCSTVKENLSLKRSEELSSEQVKRAFQKIEDLTGDSPRKAKVRRNNGGDLQLVIEVDPEEME